MLTESTALEGARRLREALEALHEARRYFASLDQHEQTFFKLIVATIHELDLALSELKAEVREPDDRLCTSD